MTSEDHGQGAKAGNLRFRPELTCGELETKLVSEGSTRFYGSAPRTAGTPQPPSGPASTNTRPAKVPRTADERADVGVVMAGIHPWSTRPLATSCATRGYGIVLAAA